MDFNFNEDQLMLRNAVREFVEAEIAPHAAAWDEEDICPVELFPRMGEMGMTGIFVPEEYGGAGLGHIEKAIVTEEVSRYSAGLGIALMTHHLGIAAILYFGSEEQKRKYLPDLAAGKRICGLAVTEPTGGSDLGNCGTMAEKSGEGWTLNGRKCFITNSHISDVTVVTAKTGVNEKGRTLLSAFIIEKGTEGFGPGRKENKLGLRGSVTGDLVMNNVYVGSGSLLGGEGAGQKVALSCIGEVGRAGMSAICTGILRGCVEEAVKFSEQRIIYGKPLRNVPAVQSMIAQNRVDYEASKLLTYRAAFMKDSGVPCTTEFAAAKLFSTEASVRAAKRTMDMMGGYGIINEYPVGRFLRDGLASIAAGGTSQIQEMVIAGATIKEFQA
jgi:butyryl-CoA dehydrogenase